MRLSRSGVSRLLCPHPHDYLAKTERLPEAAIQTGTHLEIEIGRNALSLIGDIAETESMTETGIVSQHLVAPSEQLRLASNLGTTQYY